MIDSILCLLMFWNSEIQTKYYIESNTYIVKCQCIKLPDESFEKQGFYYYCNIPKDVDTPDQGSTIWAGDLYDTQAEAVEYVRKERKYDLLKTPEDVIREYNEPIHVWDSQENFVDYVEFKQ